MSRSEYDIDGREFSEIRGLSMSSKAAPEDYSWSHCEIGEEDGDGVVCSSLATKRAFRAIRREWLAGLILEVSTNSENGYRYWRWTNPETGKVAWWERRPWNEDSSPGEAGFWPDNGGYVVHHALASLILTS